MEKKKNTENIKLSCKWQFWCLSNNPRDREKPWNEKLQRIGAQFDTMDRFCSLFKSVTEAKECELKFWLKLF